jgi:hypothetical protein
MTSAIVTKSTKVLTNVPKSRLVETHGENSAGKFWALSVATVVDMKILIVECRFPFASDLALNDCEEIVLLQIRKLLDASYVK